MDLTNECQQMMLQICPAHYPPQHPQQLLHFKTIREAFKKKTEDLVNLALYPLGPPLPTK